MVFSNRERSDSRHSTVTQQDLNATIESLSGVLRERGRTPMSGSTATPRSHPTEDEADKGEFSIMSRSSSFLLPHRIPQVPTVAQLPAASSQRLEIEGGKTFSIQHNNDTQYFRMGPTEGTDNIKETIRSVFSLPPADNFNLLDMQNHHIVVSSASLLHTAHYTLMLPEKPQVSYMEVPCTPAPHLLPPQKPTIPVSDVMSHEEMPKVVHRVDLKQQQQPLLVVLRNVTLVSLLFAVAFLGASYFLTGSPSGVEIGLAPPGPSAVLPVVWRNNAGKILVRYTTVSGGVKDHRLTEGLNTVPDAKRSKYRLQDELVFHVDDEL
eukprot:TRINITY_DN2762_c0_g1_i4.p1 TRINITY_DN2762_c0_g1~~TRINITY_DN2762_c0_g1_i4.p1  ORF type:complete len:322 (+),score=58.14 TRINITY_DN2762_c0_g1_i4:46-1011(+)